MYSIVMLTAMSAGADVTPPPMKNPPPVVAVAPVAVGCCGGVVMTGCTGCSGYSSCHGCGGGFLGLRSGGGLFHKHSCHGCTGCSGYSCFGSCHGTVSYGSSWGPPVGMLPYTLHGYNSGATVVWGAGPPVVLHNLTNPHAVYGRVTNPNPPPVMVIPVAPVPKGSDSMPMGANLRFKVPADAKVFVDDNKDPAPGTGTDRVFYTPPLARGKKFFYEVKIKYTVDKKEVTSETVKVTFEAGENVFKDLTKLSVAAVEKADTVAGK